MLRRLLRSAFGARVRADDSRAGDGAPLGRLAGAVAAGKREDVVRLLPEIDRLHAADAGVHRDIGARMGQAGMLDLARVRLEKAVALDENHPGGWADLGTVLRLEGRLDEAERCYRRAIALDPGADAVHLNLAALEAQSGRSEAALARLRATLGESGAPLALRALVELLDRLQRPAEALQVCDEVLARVPHHGVALAAKGFLLVKREHLPEDALACFEAAIAAGERDPELFCNRGIALQDLGRIDEALASYEAALALDPHAPTTRFHRGLALLMKHEFAHAWDDYEMRLASVDRPPAPCSLPAWDGSPTQDPVLVYGEQGIGDEIMFASCVPDLLRSCPNVVLACTPKLESLFARSFPQARVMSLARAADAGAQPAPVARRTVAIGSLPSRFRRSPAAFPRHDGYLRADPAMVAHYRSRLEGLGPGLKVGLSWRGGTDKTRRSLRSLGPQHVHDLLDLPGVRVVNLQYDSRADDPELAACLAGSRVVHWQDALDDYDRTAALVASLDVVVSVCTAVIHLAGALGRPTLVMAAYSPEWRYGIAGTAMPWYPAVRVERQPAPRDWDAVVARVRADLNDRAEAHARLRGEP